MDPRPPTALADIVPMGITATYLRGKPLSPAPLPYTSQCTSSFPHFFTGALVLFAMCGIVGIVRAPGDPVAAQLYDSLVVLQHR